MFLDTIYKEDFHNFLKNPTDFILSGVVMNENEKGYYYRFIRVPMANGEHSVEALFGQMCSNYPTSMSKDHFLEQHNLEFMAYVVDHEKTYAESYEFLRLFDVTSAYTGPHSAMGEMTKTLWDYLEQKTILDPDYLNTPELQNKAYENAVKQYVLQKKDTTFEESLRKFFEHIDDTATIVRKPSPKSNSVTFLPGFFFKISIISFTASALHPNLKTLWSSWKTLSFLTTDRSLRWLQAVWKLWGFQSRRVITTRTTSPPLMCQSSLSASITLF